MPGQRSSPSSRRRRQTAPATPVAPYVDRRTIRVSNLYGTAWRAEHDRVARRSLADTLSFGRLEQFYRASADQLPEVISSRPLDPGPVTCQRWHEGAVTTVRLWLFLTPSAQVVVGFSLDVDCSHVEAVNLLEDCYHLTFAVEGIDLVTLAAEEARRHGVDVEAEEFTSERHQIVFSRALDGNDPADLIQRLIYRANLPYRSEFSAISYPGELNRRPNTTAAVGPYVSVLCGQQDYVENTAFVSAVQAVASSVRLREIRNALYHDLRRFRAVERTRDTRARRRTLEQITDNLTRLELDLSVSVEAPADLRVLVPSLRVAEYHQGVYSAIGIKELAGTVSRMLQRLEATGRAELTTVESIERRADEDRRLRWGVAIGFVSVVAIPISLILTFLGINASQVDEQRSMFDPAYAWVYVGVGLLAVIAALLAFTLYVYQTRRRREHVDGRTEGRSRALPAAVPVQPAPNHAPSHPTEPSRT